MLALQLIKLLLSLAFPVIESGTLSLTRPPLKSNVPVAQYSSLRMIESALLNGLNLPAQIAG
ncbi:hypothetical protein GcM1_249202 [Golovinomyces cichoracearum]|uniref:Effector protein n=1 Tax=Golovinomyces cichoracearum TaxID=62708 RepID=A0A420IC71_9PEZI|nr:hypothetical protein GcM1_249202 [Golovinomyces cichoracearum]